MSPKQRLLKSSPVEKLTEYSLVIVFVGDRVSEVPNSLGVQTVSID